MGGIATSRGRARLEDFISACRVSMQFICIFEHETITLETNDVCFKLIEDTLTLFERVPSRVLCEITITWLFVQKNIRVVLG